MRKPRRDWKVTMIYFMLTGLIVMAIAAHAIEVWRADRQAQRDHEKMITETERGR